MQPSSQDRVEFFHSESSFGSESSLSDSRYYDFTNEIIAETDNIFLTLKRELLPNESLLQQQRVKFALSRAQLIHKDTIPEHLAYLHKIEAPARALAQVTGCAEKLGRLLEDYDKLRSSTMIYKQFYNLYGKEFGLQEGGFSRKKEVLIESEDALLQPECIQINYADKQKLRATPRLFLPANPNDKELAALRQQLYALKKALEEVEKTHAVQLSNQKLNCEKRLRTYLTALPESNALRQELTQTNDRLVAALEQLKALQTTLAHQNAALHSLQADHDSLLQQLQLARRIDHSVEEDHNNSYSSEVAEDRKHEKRLRNALQENQLLRQQLATERHRLYRLSTDQTDEQRRELERTRKQLQAKTEELDLLFADFDKQRVQILQLTHQAAAATKLNDALRAENQLLAQQLKRVPETPAPLSALPLPLPLPLSRCHVDPYEGQGVEGYPYYETLSKEFRVRFRRACLKEKELLYKANGMEIGVITSFEQPNGLSFLLHLTNYGDAPLEGLRGKVMNPNGNRLSNDSFQYARLEPSEQLKVNCLLHLAYYPIGPLTFLLEFTALAKHEIRILLPAHIFKTVELEDRSSPLADPLALHIPTERKICKDLNDLKAYLKGCKVGKGGMRTAVYHRQTHTVLHMDLEEAKEGLALHYEHVEGNKDISDYFIKTFAFLLAK